MRASDEHNQGGQIVIYRLLRSPVGFRTNVFMPRPTTPQTKKTMAASGRWARKGGPPTTDRRPGHPLAMNLFYYHSLLPTEFYLSTFSFTATSALFSNLTREGESMSKTFLTIVATLIFWKLFIVPAVVVKF